MADVMLAWAYTANVVVPYARPRLRVDAYACALIHPTLGSRLHYVPFPSSPGGDRVPKVATKTPRPSASFPISSLPRTETSHSRLPPDPSQPQPPRVSHPVASSRRARIRPNTRSGPPCEFVPEPLLCHDAAPSTLLTRCCQASRHHIHHRARHPGRHRPADARTAAGQHRQGPQGLHRGRHQPARGVTEPLPERPAGSHRHADTRGRRGTGWRDAGRRDAPRTPTEQEPPAPGQARPT
ncbi:DNA damage-inducible protein 1 [Alternaria alternata]|jgi:hypothetical protein|nr:DNA damage-inducible protein 1 [Alternaria alternata]